MTANTGGLRLRAESSRAPVVRRPRPDILDLRAIQTELRALGEVTITSSAIEGEAGDIDDVVALGIQSLNDLRMVGSTLAPHRWLTVSLDRDVARTSGPEHDSLVAGVELRVLGILRPHRNRVAQWCDTWAPLAVIGVSVLASILADLASDGTSVGLQITAVGVVVAVAMMMFGWRSKGRIMLVRRDDAPSWLARNRDSLIVDSLVGVLLLVGGFVLGKAA
ncbi:hypothetical protein [Cellulomonas timonensis]|uniref:hypothetical protein n=1 Tax=Cellulomonas timonensis TaxID=1689271 RepID=UPI000836A781|nr:hypothetical protein [Cellulomonas timonensis]